MLCDVCRIGLEGIWDPSKSKRIGLIEEFPEILQLRFDHDEFEKALSKRLFKLPILLTNCQQTPQNSKNQSDMFSDIMLTTIPCCGPRSSIASHARNSGWPMTAMM